MKKIKICHVLMLNPQKNIGGTPLVVKELMKRIDSDYVCGVGYGFFRSIISPFFNAIIILTGGYDIVHIHDTQGYVYAMLPKFMRKKMVFTAHGITTGYFDAMKPEGFFQRLKAMTEIFMHKMIIKKSDAVIAVSNHIKSEIIKQYRVDGSKIFVIYNGVDTDKFKPAGKRKINVAIWVGDNPELKQLNKTIDYAKRHRMKLIVVGVNGINTEDVEYIGKIPPEKMPEIYNKANVLLFFSKAEGHPLVPLEAMASGLSVVASKESNIEIIPMKNNLYVINGRKAREIVKKYDWKIQSKKYAEIYERLTKSD